MAEKEDVFITVRARCLIKGKWRAFEVAATAYDLRAAMKEAQGKLISCQHDAYMAVARARSDAGQDLQEPVTRVEYL